MSNAANDILPTSVPKLDVSGANWAIFALCFQTVIQEKGLWGHFDGSSPCSVLSSPMQPSDKVYSLPFVITPPPFLAFQMTFSEHHLHSCYSY